MSAERGRVGRTVLRWVVVGAGVVAAFAVGYLMRWGCAPAQHPAEAAPEGAPAPAASQPAEAPTIWTCAMHPQIRQPKPGRCPICGMKLVPVETGVPEEGGAAPRLAVSEEAARL